MVFDADGAAEGGSALAVALLSGSSDVLFDVADLCCIMIVSSHVESLSSSCPGWKVILRKKINILANR